MVSITTSGARSSPGRIVETRNFLVAPTLNFSNDVENSFFAEVRAGVTLSYAGSLAPNSTLFAYLVGVGKRFEITSHVAYMPEIIYSGTTSNDTTPSVGSFSIVPVQFSFTL